MTFFKLSLQVQMHRLPLQTKADHLHGDADHSHHLGPGNIHHVSLGGDVASDQGAKRSSVTGLRQQNQSVLLVPRELAQPGDEEDLHHRPVCKHLPRSPFAHRHHVRPDRHHAFQNGRPRGREAGPRQPPQRVQEEAEGD